MKAVSIIIITLNEERNIGRLLGELQRQTYRNFEVIVVDSNSSDATCDIARSYDDRLSLTVHRMVKQGTSLGRNTGAALARHERLLFLDADVHIRTDFIARSLERLERSGLEVAGVYMGAKGLPLRHKLGYSLFNIGFFITQFIFPTAVGACLFSTQTAHNRLGGFDEDIVLCEDCDYVRRAGRTWRFRFLLVTFGFDPRRLNQEGTIHVGLTYLRANVRRLLLGEMRSNEIEYKFGHYS